MKTIKVKICGITKIEEALICKQIGVDFLGFVFLRGHKYYLPLERFAEIINVACDQSMQAVGVFVNPSEKEIDTAITRCKIKYVQLHGEESPQFCAQIQFQYQVIVIKGINVCATWNTGDIQAILESYKKNGILYFILDRAIQGQGEMINSSLIRNISTNNIFLAGGLTPNNVKEVLTYNSPFGIDISSGVEINGIKSVDKIKQLFNALHD